MFLSAKRLTGLSSPDGIGSRREPSHQHARRLKPPVPFGRPTGDNTERNRQPVTVPSNLCEAENDCVWKIESTGVTEMNREQLSGEVVDDCVQDLDTLCRDEYGQELIDVLGDSDRDRSARRMRRLAGILLKRDFAVPKPIGEGPTKTDANRAWIWQSDKLEQPANPNSGEYCLIDAIREELPAIPGHNPTWDDLLFEAEHERGLFKVLAQYVEDKLEKRETKSFREYHSAKESPVFKAQVDLANTVFNFAMTPVYASILPVPGIVVALSVIGIQFGYDSIFSAEEERDESN